MSSPFSPPLEVEEIGAFPSVDELAVRLRGLAAPFILESSLDVAGMGRWHILGAEPIGEARVCGDRWHLELLGRRRDGEGRPWRAVEEWWRAWAVDGPATDRQEGEFPLGGGAVGYLGYELGDHLESLPPRRQALSRLPDLHLRLYDELLLVERATGRGYFLHRGREGVEERRWWRQGVASVPQEETPRVVPVRRSIDDQDYRAAVEEIRAAIGRGDVYEVNLTRCDTFEGGPSVWELYRRLRRSQPVPYAALLPWQPLSVVSASPERFLWRRGDRVETRPIKGTAPRGASEEQDRRAAEELLASEKERAELAMIIDLERNDLGRVCESGSVRVVEEAALERYSTVLHTVATVQGTLPERLSPFTLLRATFPGGSITGAPKIAAMQMIRRLEPMERKVYTGCIGWIAPDGDLELSVAIRTVMRFEGSVLFSVGGAITWDSDPDAELAELEAKGRAIFRALGCECDQPPI